MLFVSNRGSRTQCCTYLKQVAHNAIHHTKGTKATCTLGHLYPRLDIIWKHIKRAMKLVLDVFISKLYPRKRPIWKASRFEPNRKYNQDKLYSKLFAIWMNPEQLAPKATCHKKAPVNLNCLDCLKAMKSNAISNATHTQGNLHLRQLTPQVTCYMKAPKATRYLKAIKVIKTHGNMAYESNQVKSAYKSVALGIALGLSCLAWFHMESCSQNNLHPRNILHSKQLDYCIGFTLLWLILCGKLTCVQVSMSISGYWV